MLDSSQIKQWALDVGFDDCGIARADALTDDEYPLHEWLRRGWHGDLAYMERNADKRMDPRLLVPGAKSVICLVSAYPPPDSVGGTAAYARTREYHEDIKKMLHALLDRLSPLTQSCLSDSERPATNVEQSNQAIKQSFKLCCDTVPISDKHWAARAGLGWIGRHTLLVTKRWGSWVNLAEIVTTEECSEYDSDNLSPFTFHLSPCTSCNRCVAACPNQALAPLTQSNNQAIKQSNNQAIEQSSNQAIKQSYLLNVTRCTAYYTTHHSRPLPPDVDTRGYTQGCDLCQLACPFNQKK
jgi:epoxyqueuosine reductase